MAEAKGEKAQRDRNLLFGVIAVQMRFILPADLARAAAQWAVDVDKGLGEVLIDMGLIEEKARGLVQGMLDFQIKHHDGNASATLASFGGNLAVHESFAASIVAVEEKGESTLIFTEEDEVRESEGPALGARIDDSSAITLEHPGRYTIKGEYGRGAIGRVLIAFDEHVGREVALKAISRDSPRDTLRPRPLCAGPPKPPPGSSARPASPGNSNTPASCRSTRSPSAPTARPTTP